MQAETKKRITERIDKEGVAGFVEEVADGKARVLVFATYWSQVGAWKPGDALQLQASDAAYRGAGERVEVRVVTRKNLGTYGSGATELLVEGIGLNEKLVSGWSGAKVVRVFAVKPPE